MNAIEKQFSTGAIQATIWNNNKNGQINNSNVFTISLTRRYKDRQGNWKFTNNFSLTDLPKARLVLGKAYEHLMLKSEAIEMKPIPL
ncbi:MAG: hypothetical protein KAT43_05590 [Nanoarchaeota archaeon]|nr:hypothetical protein [Nanoarchaeota archaeon]